jgi:predicted nucleic acid-binding protein
VIILIDSDILIEISHGRNEDELRKWVQLQDSDHVLMCSPVTVAELWHGARPNEHRSLDDLFAALLCIPIDNEIGRRASDYLRQFGRSHNLELRRRLHRGDRFDPRRCFVDAQSKALSCERVRILLGKLGD